MHRTYCKCGITTNMPAVSTPTYSMCVLGHVLCTDIKTAHEGIFPIGVHIRILYSGTSLIRSLKFRAPRSTGQML